MNGIAKHSMNYQKGSRESIKMIQFKFHIQLNTRNVTAMKVDHDIDAQPVDYQQRWGN